jgi:nucleotide-binding universal stress UspA family protein
MFKTILVAFDGSDNAVFGLNKAIELGKLYSSKIIVFYSVQHYFRTLRTFPIPFLGSVTDPIGLDAETEATVFESHRNIGERLLSGAKQLVDDAGLECETELVVDKGPVEAAQLLVETKEIDLIIIGAKGTHGALSRGILGSVTTGIVNNVCTNIFVVRSECGPHGKPQKEPKKQQKGKVKN